MKKFFNAIANAFRSDPNKVLDNGYTRLQRAILENDLSAVVSLVKAGADVNFRGALVYPPLHFALERDRHHIALALLQAGADVNLQDVLGQSPLHKAAEHAQESFVLALLKQGADPNVRDKEGKTPLHVMSTAKPELIDALARHKAHLNEKDAMGNTPMHLFLDKPQIIERLLVNGADPNVRNDQGLSPYMMMLEEERFQKYHKVLQHMLAYKADVGTTNQLGETVLHLAGRLEMQETFDAAFTKAELTRTDQNGNNVLHALVRTQNVRMIAKVLNRAPELLQQKNNFGRTPLAELVRRADRLISRMDEKFIATARLMIMKGADPSVTDDHGRTLLHHAVNQDKQAFIEFLMDSKINPNVLDADGKAALHVAIARGQDREKGGGIALLDILLDKGADPDLTDARGWTVLDRLAEKGDRDSPIVQRLIVGGGSYQKQLPLNSEQMRNRDQGLGKKVSGGGFGFK